MVRSGPQKFPGASTAYWYQTRYPGSAMESNVGVIHTTEGRTVPSYGGGASAPNFTMLPDFANKRLRVYQHFDFDVSSRALVNLSGGVQTNTANAVQIELVGTCDERHATTWDGKRHGVDYLFWPDAPDWALAELGKFVRWAHDNHAVKMQSTVTWKPYNKGQVGGSYGNNGVRLTGAQWSAYYGWLGHQHVPENSHGDPGDIDMAKILAYAKGETPQEDDPMAGMTPKDIAKAAWLTDGVVGVPEDWSPGNTEWMPASILIDANKRIRGVEKQLAALTAANAKLVDTVGQLAGQMGDLDPAAIVAELSQALESIQLRIDVPDQA